MNSINEINSITDQEQKKFILDVVDKMAEVLFFWWVESEFGDEEVDFKNPDDDQAERITDFIGFIWNVAMMCTASIGFEPIGKSADGKVYAQISPITSVKKLLTDSGFALDEHSSYEETFIDPPSVASPYVEEGEGGEIISLGEFEKIFFSSKQ